MTRIACIASFVLATMFSIGCQKHEAILLEKATMPSEPLSTEIDGDVEFFVIRGGPVPWGDYGNILTHGMTAHLPRIGGQIQLERTGPFVPPITFPGIGDIVVTTDMRDAMVLAGFRGIEFRPVLNSRIVELDWHTWNAGAEKPKYYPKEGEPEGFILDLKHSESMSKRIGVLWELVVEDGVTMEEIQTGKDISDFDFQYVAGSRNDSDIFSCSLHSGKYCSKRAKIWFEKYFPQWTSFEPVRR